MTRLNIVIVKMLENSMLHQYLMQRLLEDNESGNKPSFRTQSLNNYDIQVHA